jgi:hypothetical protein
MSRPASGTLRLQSQPQIWEKAVALSILRLVYISQSGTACPNYQVWDDRKERT